MVNLCNQLQEVIVHMAKRRLPNPETIAIGKRIAKARHSKGLTQEELADKLDVTTSLVGQYEKGRSGLTAKRLHQLIDILEVDMNYILTGYEPEEEIKAHTKIEKDLLFLIRQIDLDKQEILYKNIEQLAETIKKLSQK
ncbi:hypothetical protein COMNV_00741 [Commensalibacter sp. Nvir]|uniref:helix-turn-helix domain-containing protein n=1 Tax=Commensalibacter sp. Nvir TaxID=3069817 RepID=UPI002D5D31F0|nr:hypothetical protein COMNV_00741 [Commensalibacter sp. Nvir]